jgi:hypothetical protein
MGDDRWTDRRFGDEPLWGDERRRERPRSSASQDWGPEDYDRYDDNRGYAERNHAERSQARLRAEDHDDTRYRPFGDNGPISTRSGAYTGEGRPYGRDTYNQGAYNQGGRYDDLSPRYRDFETSQRRIHRGDYDPDRYTPNPREGRGEEPRTWFDRAQDEVGSWFGDEHARRRREWDERQADVRDERRSASYSGLDERADRRGAPSGLDYRSDQGGWSGLDYRGEHRGRGPKGYQRSDARIADDLNDRLTDDAYLDASEIDVKVEDGEATLSGFVARREDKRRAEDLAETILGVSHVQNNLRVRPGSSIPRGDYIVP